MSLVTKGAALKGAAVLSTCNKQASKASKVIFFTSNKLRRINCWHQRYKVYTVLVVIVRIESVFPGEYKMFALLRHEKLPFFVWLEILEKVQLCLLQTYRFILQESNLEVYRYQTKTTPNQETVHISLEISVISRSLSGAFWPPLVLSRPWACSFIHTGCIKQKVLIVF